MKPSIIVTSLLSAVIFNTAVISGRILYGSDKGTLRSYSGTTGKKYGHQKTGDRISSKRTSRKLPVAGSLLRPESLVKAPQSSDVGKSKGKRYGCCICHGCQPCVGGCMPNCDCDCCRHKCDEGCWCPIPGAEEAPKKKPAEEPCCCPCCCPCCPVPTCHHCCHHIHHHHHHCCPCCHCCHCCHCCNCCPCCCHCCHCKRSQGPFSPAFLRRPLFLYMVTPYPSLSGLYAKDAWSLLQHGPLRVH